MQELSTKDMQRCELDILKEFDRICREHQLTYSLAYGTMIGAIRHKGFIPWDDDVDVLMKREDYEKLLSLAFENDRYEIKSCRYSKDYYYPFAKMVDKNTVLVEPWRAEKNMGVYIDIFPFDYLSEEDVRDFEKTRKKIYRRERIANIYGQKYFHYFGLNSKFLIKLVFAPTFLFRKSIINYVDRACIKPCDKYCMMMLNSSNVAKYHENELFSGVEYLPFENEEFPVYKCYDYFLTKIYGDYMTPPPPEKQKTVHWFKAYSK